MIELETPARLLACAGAAALLAACGTVSALPSPTPRQAPAASATAPAPTPAPDDSRTGTPEEAAAFVAARVPPQYPRLLPRSIPAGMTAHVRVGAGGYQVEYTDDLHARHVAFAGGIGVNPPLPAGDHVVSTYRQFRGVRASYQVYDSTAPLSMRYLHWYEPGSWPRLPDGGESNECYLSASGMTEAELFQVAGSLHAVS